MDLLYLTDFAVAYRYPGFQATEADAARAVAIATSFHSAARRHFGLP